jgi:DNA-binding protein HU-beta
MNKSELVAAIAEEADLTKADAEKALKALEKVIIAALKKGDKVSVVGFFTAERTHRKASTGRNPRTGDPIKIAAKHLAKFKAGKSLVDALN